MSRQVLEPVPSDLWHRLAVLEGLCGMKLERHSKWRSGGDRLWAGVLEFPRLWQLWIWPRELGPGWAVICTGDDLARVLAAGVRIAEEKGWHRAARGLRLVGGSDAPAQEPDRKRL